MIQQAYSEKHQQLYDIDCNKYALISVFESYGKFNATRENEVITFSPIVFFVWSVFEPRFSFERFNF